MSTRGTIKFRTTYQNETTDYVTLYNHWDSYVSGLGHELAQWLLGVDIVNGIHMGKDYDKKPVNGFGDLIAQYIADTKTGIGGLYVTTLNDYQDYNYIITFNEEKYFNRELGESLTSDDLIEIEIYFYDEKQIFKGTPSELLKFKESWEDE